MIIQTKSFVDQKTPELRRVAGSGLRLCQVITHPKNRGGSGLRTLQDAELAKSLGYHVEIVTGTGNPKDYQTKVIPTKINYLRLPALRKYIDPHQDVAALIGLFRLFRKNKYHVVHTHLSKAGILGRLAAGLARVPIVVHSVHGPSFGPHQSLILRQTFIGLEKLAGFFTTHYIFWSSHLQEAYRAQGIGKKADMRVIYPGIDFSPYIAASKISEEERARERAAWGIKTDDLVVGYIARIVYAKGQELAIKACHALASRYPNLKLVLVGGAVRKAEIAYLQQLKSLVKYLGMAERVIFTGHQNQVGPYYRMLDIFVFPSLYEGIGLAPLEAFVAGLPVVSFDIIGLRKEFLGDGGIFVPCYDISALTEGLVYAIENLEGDYSGKRRREKKKDEIIETFSFQKWRNKLEAFYIYLDQDLRARGLQGEPEL
jgi:glycosyltransferase involved in cell wall biosynthesis